MIQGDFSLYVLIFPALPDLSVPSRLMMIPTLKALNPVKKKKKTQREPGPEAQVLQPETVNC